MPSAISVYGASWTSEEASVVSRMATALRWRGVEHEVVSGETDAGDPWMALIQDDVTLIHVARYGSVYVCFGIYGDRRALDLQALLAPIMQNTDKGGLIEALSATAHALLVGKGYRSG